MKWEDLFYFIQWTCSRVLRQWRSVDLRTHLFTFGLWPPSAHLLFYSAITADEPFPVETMSLLKKQRSAVFFHFTSGLLSTTFHPGNSESQGKKKKKQKNTFLHFVDWINTAAFSVRWKRPCRGFYSHFLQKAERLWSCQQKDGARNIINFWIESGTCEPFGDTMVSSQWTRHKHVNTCE